MNATANTNRQKRLATITTAAGLSLVAACYGPRVDLNSTGSAGASGSANSGEASGASGGASGGGSGATCDVDAGRSDGSGYSGLLPTICGDPPTPSQAPVALSTTADVLAAIAGTWINCGSASFFSLLATSGASGVDFAPQGVLVGLVIDGGSNLVPLASAVGYLGSAGDNSDPLTTASYDVVDSSATLGAGTFQIRMTGSNGTVEIAQILTYQNPARIQLVNASSTISLVRPVTFAYRAGVCPDAFAGGTMAPAGTDVRSLVAGRWIWCGGAGQPEFRYGFDVPGDGTLVELDIDPTGNFVPLTTIAAGSFIGTYGDPPSVRYPLTLELGTCPATLQTTLTEGSGGPNTPAGFYVQVP